MKTFLWIPLGVIAFFILFVVWASHPWSLGQKVVEAEVLHIEPQGMVNNEENPSVIKIMTWNLGFLFGEGSEGPGYVAEDKTFYEEKLAKFAQEVLEAQPDVILLQEIDFDSSRSHNIDQARYIAEKANYPYVAEAVSWDANYIPFPYWPITRNFGGMKSGGAIISKYPILDHKVTLLEKPMSQPWWYNLFYLHRYIQQVTIQLGDKPYKFVNVHLEAFDKKNREDQVKQILAIIEKEKIDVIAGDFNMVPTSAVKKSKFTFNDDEYENDPSFELMKKSGLSEVIPEEIYSQEESRYFTFPASKPDRRLDYIFFQSNLKMMKAEVLPSALSDHVPLRAIFQIGNANFSPYSQ